MEPEAKVSTTQIIAVIAAVLSAIAAGFSGWTAYQQKQATFDSLIFNKELEAVSIVASETAYLKQYSDTMMNEPPARYHSGTPGAQFFIDRNREIDSQELQSWNRMSQALDSLKILTPGGQKTTGFLGRYRDTADRTHTKARNASHYLSTQIDAALLDKARSELKPEMEAFQEQTKLFVAYASEALSRGDILKTHSFPESLKKP